MNAAFQEFLATQSTTVSLSAFSVNLLLTALLCYLLSLIYIQFGSSFTNRKQFGRNFLLIGVSTMLIITIVKSSIALSLGLVGALSIVRFRTPIKDPEELAFLFLSIAFGLGLGANQVGVTLVGFTLISAIVVGRAKIQKQEANQNLFLTITSQGPNILELQDLVGVLNKNCTMINLRRLEKNKDGIEADFAVDFKGIDDFSAVQRDLLALDDSINITFLDNKGIQA